jgi:hypothetical protein
MDKHQIAWNKKVARGIILDATGNRIAAMTFGPKRSFLLWG